MSNKKLIYFTRYTRLAPSSRFRSYQFIPEFEAQGIEYVMCPLFNDRYMTDLFSREPKKDRFNAILCYLNRFVQILKYARARHFIIVEKEFFPYLPAFVEWWMNKLGIGYAVDIDDAVFAYYDNLSNPILKFLLGKKMDKVFKHSRFVLAGNDYLSSRAKQAGAKEVVFYPTVIDVPEYQRRIRNYDYKKNDGSKVIVGWVGSPSTVKYFQRIVDVLDELSLTVPFDLYFIGSNVEFPFKNIRPKYIPFSEETEVEKISEFEIGIMPLKDTDFERGKCGLKLIQYFGCRLPVVASPVGVNSSIVEEGVNGFLAESDEDWKIHLTSLITDPELRDRLGNSGFDKAKSAYDIRVNIEKLKELIERT